MKDCDAAVILSSFILDPSSLIRRNLREVDVFRIPTEAATVANPASGSASSIGEFASPADAVPPNDAAAVPRGRSRRHHVVLLAVSAVVLVLSFLLEVVGDGRVAFRGLESYPLPHSCYMRMMFDQGCPGCGMTRGFIHIANGRLRESLAVHPLAWLLFVGLLAQFPYRLVALRGNNPHPLGTRWPTLCGWSLIGLLLATWLVRLLW